MKKFYLVLALALSVMTMSAQRAAVMEFKAGVGISQADVDGLCGMFTTGFRPAGYTMIERSQIDRIISEQNMQRSNLTESQMVRIGQLLNLSCIVIGDVNVVMGEYNVDVRVINVESSVIIATAGKAMTSAFGENMRSLAQTLAARIAIQPGETVQATPQTTPQSTQNSEYVDLGLPSGTKWKNENEKGGFFTYEKAMKYFGDKLPTKQQFEELIDLCDWEWDGKGCKVIGPNNNSIYLPAAGYFNHNHGTVCGASYVGLYWSSTENDSNYAYNLTFYSDSRDMNYDERESGRSVRAVLAQ